MSDFEQFDCFETNFDKKRKKCVDCPGYDTCIAEKEFYDKEIGKNSYVVIQSDGEIPIIKYNCLDPFTALEKQLELAKNYGLDFEKRIQIEEDFPISYTNSAVEFLIQKEPFVIDSVYLADVLLNLAKVGEQE